MTRVLLAGGGHTHLVAGPALARRLGPGTEIALLAPAPRLLYSGMMPGWLAGQYAYDDCAIDLHRVATSAGLHWVADTLVDVDFAAREAVGASGRRHRYDLLSLNVGSSNLLGDRAPGSTVRVLGAKPFADFVDGWTAWLDGAPAAPRCVVVGGGAAAVEIACALAALVAPGARLAGGSVALATTGSALLPGQARVAAALAARSLDRRGVALHLSRRYLGVEGAFVRLAQEGGAGGVPSAPSGSAAPSGPTVPSTTTELRLPADLLIVATGARPPGWLTDAARRAGLPVAPDGGLAVDGCMRSKGDARVLASGDCATFVDAAVPKSGVHALRQGPPLAESIARAAAGPAGDCTDAARYVAQRRALALLNRCDGSAIAVWGPLGAAGAAWWRWKDRIDRRFIARFR
jgi:NADH dehydrogenase FAD-containing subunit